MRYQPTPKPFPAFVLAALAALVLACLPAARPVNAGTVYRDPLLWPFAQNSIWNMPIGLGARYVPARIGIPTGAALVADEDVLILTPNAPRRVVYLNTAGWDPSLSRCGTIDRTMPILPQPVPVPPSFSTEPGPGSAGYLGGTPNMSAAILLPDGRTVVQTQPFHVCGPGGLLTSQYTFPNADLITGDGIAGAHGGSGMSSIGGTLRLGELVPGGVIRHALKLELDGALYYYYSPTDPTPGYRWPALTADDYAATNYGGHVPALKMGSLLALPPSFPIKSLSTTPGKILARALQDYGAYVVDDAAWDAVQIATEWGPRGRVIDEFQHVWGFSFQPDVTVPCAQTMASCRWATDLARIVTHLAVVDNNSPACIGGCGARRAPLALPFDPKLIRN
jgi:hypothetical protein